MVIFLFYRYQRNNLYQTKLYFVSYLSMNTYLLVDLLNCKYLAWNCYACTSKQKMSLNMYYEITHRNQVTSTRSRLDVFATQIRPTMFYWCLCVGHCTLHSTAYFVSIFVPIFQEPTVLNWVVYIICGIVGFPCVMAAD